MKIRSRPSKDQQPAASDSKRAAPGRLTKSKIADWARAFRARTGQWPTAQSGPIPESKGDTWGTVNIALSLGTRGLPGGVPLDEFLRNYQYRPSSLPKLPIRRITETQILRWAQEYFDRAGRWPYQHAGLIPDAGGLTWMAINEMLRRGTHGLPGGTSLAKLLRKRRGSARNVHSTPLTARKILAWADAHHDRTGEWPHERTGEIPESPGTTWQAVMTALHSGYRGFKGGQTLGQFLAKHRGVPLQPKRRTPLTIPQILAWADAFHARTGQWPIKRSGRIPGTVNETWDNISMALYNGGRGLPRSSLAQVLAEHRGVRNASDLPSLSRAQILRWADEHFGRTGAWPKRESGLIPDSGGETWQTVFAALYSGSRGLTGRTTLMKFLQLERPASR